MRARSVMGALVLVVAAAAPAAGQAWDNPSFFAPRAHDDVGLYVVNPEFGDLGFAAIWRQSGNINLGVRGGIAGTSDARLWLLGAELYGPLRLLQDPRFLVAWNTGIGAGFVEGDTYMRIPLGVSAGLELGTGSGFTVVPYVHPRVVFDLFAFDAGGGEEITESEFGGVIDLGADVQIGERWLARGGVSFDGVFRSGDTNFGSETIFGFGIAYRIPRPISIR